MLLTNKDMKIKVKAETATKGTFELEPLPKGYGYTLGNSLRRVLLTSMEGAAITSIRVKGVSHQFSTLKGMKEDIVQLMLNLKEVRFKSYSENPVVATIKVRGPATVTAKDIEASSELEVMNKDAYIATLADNKSELEIEMIVEKGTGYSPSEERPSTKVGVIVMDAIFSPVLRVQVDVKEARAGQRVDLDKLVLDVETDGSIKPSEAVYESAKNLAKFFATISNWEIGSDDEDKPQTKTEESQEEMEIGNGDVAVEDLPLQTRTINALKKHGIATLKQLAEKSDEELSDIKNLGEKSIGEIKELLISEGLR